MSFRAFRILVLLGLLALAAGVTWWEGAAVTSWKRPLEIVVYPVKGDDSEAVQRYVDGLTAERFREIGVFLQEQSERYRVEKIAPVTVMLGKPVRKLPPPRPEGRHSALDAVLWSLKLRYYAFKATPFFASLGTVRLFVVYREGEEGKALEHSLGLRKGLLGVVHAYADPKQDAQNNVVIAHELLHALGATDKYDGAGMPVRPEGLGDPDREPPYPQQTAEIMAGRVARSPTEAAIPDSLAACVVGYQTAFEIKW